MKEILLFFYKLSPVARLLWSIIGPLILFLVVYRIAAAQTYRNYWQGGSPFKLDETWFTWIIFLGLVGGLEWLLWDFTNQKKNN